MISIETARQLLDFGGGADDAGMRLSSGRAESQLAGAVAIHNILERDRVAYLADEVGMGKTYVALGAFALFRHFNPRFRMLVIAPKENIQYKWVREYRNFVRNNVRFADRRVKALHQAPARSPIICDSLLELVRETSLDPDRDFFVRLTSFSLGLLDDSASWSTKRDAVLKALPWLDPALFGEEGEPHDRKIDVVYEAARGVRSIAPVTEALRSAFPVQKQLIAGPKRPLAVSPASERELMDRFTRLAVSDLGLPIEWAKKPAAGMLLGTLRRDRQQPFTLLVRSVDGSMCIRCVSPVGRVDPRADTERIAREARSIRAKVCAVYDARFNEYDLTVEGDVLLGAPAADPGRVRWLIESVVEAADRLEAVLLEIDHDPTAFEDGLEREVDFER